MILASICIFMSTLPIAYLYPVLSIDEANVLICYQPNSENIELYVFNVISKSMSKIVSSQYRTAAVRLLPDVSGISFVDNGMVRIKRFAARSVKTLEIFDPLYGIDFVEWLDASTCYFHAQSDGYFGIYSLSLDEIIKPLIVVNGVDCMYPQIVGSTLFYIERCYLGNKTLYTIKRRSYTNKFPIDKQVLCMGNRQIIFLTMVSISEGNFLEYCLNGDSITFWYHRLQYFHDWHDAVLFTFSLPKYFFSDGPNRLFESLSPFIPKRINNEIYYSSMSNNIIHLYLYDTLTTSTRKVLDKVNVLFPPVEVGNKLVVGSLLPEGELKEPIVLPHI